MHLQNLKLKKVLQHQKRDKPCCLVSPTFNESMDWASSAISPNLSGDSGFQSACVGREKKGHKNYKLIQDLRISVTDNTDLVQLIKHRLEIQWSIGVENFNPAAIKHNDERIYQRISSYFTRLNKLVWTRQYTHHQPNMKGVKK